MSNHARVGLDLSLEVGPSDRLPEEFREPLRARAQSLRGGPLQDDGVSQARLEMGPVHEIVRAIRQDDLTARRKIRGRPLAWYAAEKARRGAYAAFVGATLSAVNRGWRAVAIGDCCLLHVKGTSPNRELATSFPLSRSEEFGSSPFLVGSLKKAGDDPLPHVRVSEGVLEANDLLLFASDALAAWLLRRNERSEPAWDAIEAMRTQADFEALVAQARDDGTRNDDMTLLRVTRRSGEQGGAT